MTSIVQCERVTAFELALEVICAEQPPRCRHLVRLPVDPDDRQGPDASGARGKMRRARFDLAGCEPGKTICTAVESLLVALQLLERAPYEPVPRSIVALRGVLERFEGAPRDGL